MKIGIEIGGHKIHPAAQKFPPMGDQEFEALCADIAANGLLDPIVLFNPDGESLILDGRHRFLACLKTGVEPWFDTYTGDTPVAYVVSKNKHRRHLMPSQLAMVAAELKPLFEEEARKRQEATRFGAVGETDETVVATSPPPGEKEKSNDAEKGKSRDQAGAAMGVSGRSVSRAENVIAGGCDELQDAVRNGMIDVTIGEKLAKRPVKEQRQILKKIEENPKQNPKAVLRRHDKDKIVAKLRNAPPPPPEGPFSVIAADVSWKFDKRPDDGTQRGQTPYPGMEPDEIYRLVDLVDKWAADDCILWFWTTNAHLASGIATAVLDAWRFEGKTVLTWVKDKMGTGDWLRGKTEHCILAVRGNPVVDLHGQSTELKGAVREHSRKPEEFYKLVETLCPGSKLEMFATEAREGWQMWAPGNWRETPEE